MPQGPLDDKSIVHRRGGGRQGPNTRYTGRARSRTLHLDESLWRAWGRDVDRGRMAVVILGIPSPIPPRLDRGAEPLGHLAHPLGRRPPALLPPPARLRRWAGPDGVPQAAVGRVPGGLGELLDEVDLVVRAGQRLRAQ